MKENVARKIIIVVLIVIVSFVLGITVFEFGIKDTTTEVKPEANNNQIEEKVEDMDIVNFYMDFEGYADIRQLPKEYTLEQAVQDNCFVVGPFSTENENLYTNFLNNVENGIDANLRVAQTTIEGDVILNDIKYNSLLNNFVVVIDNSRDVYSADKDLTIRTFEHVGEYHFSDTLKCFIVYNGELTDENYASNNTYVIAILN